MVILVETGKLVDAQKFLGLGTDRAGLSLKPAIDI